MSRAPCRKITGPQCKRCTRCHRALEPDRTAAALYRSQFDSIVFLYCLECLKTPCNWRSRKLEADIGRRRLSPEA